MVPLELSVIDATIWSITLESSVTIPEASFRLIYDISSAEAVFLVMCDPPMNEL